MAAVHAQRGGRRSQAEMAVATVVVTIGRNVRDVEMGFGAWDLFREQTMSTVKQHGNLLGYTLLALGVWEGTIEDAAFYVADVPEQNIMPLTAALDMLRMEFKQQTIGLIVGQGTCLIEDNVLSEDVCPDDPEGVHHVGCGCPA